jgi:hypothetical protein
MRLRRWSIVSLLVLLTSAVATIAIVVAGLISYPLVVSSSQDVAAKNLAQLANVTANAIDQQNFGAGAGAGVGQGLIRTLQRESVSAYLIPRGNPDLRDLPFDFPASYLDQLNQGTDVSGRVTSSQSEFLLEGRPIGIDGSVVLIQPISIAGASASTIIWRLVLALVVGLIIAIPLRFAELARPQPP